MDMMVESQLIPLLGHLQEMVTTELSSDDARITGGCDSEVVGKPQLAHLIAVGTHQLLHDRQKNPGRVPREVPGSRVQHLVSQRAQSAESVIHFAGFQGLDQVDYGVSNPESPGFGHFFDAARMQIGISLLPGVLAGLVPRKNVVYDFQQVVITFVEKKSCHLSAIKMIEQRTAGSNPDRQPGFAGIPATFRFASPRQANIS